MSNIAPSTAPAPGSRRRRFARATARVAAWLTLAACGLSLLAWLTVYWAILPHIDRWRPLIEAKTSEALGVPVRIGSIVATASRWVPAVELRDVVLLDAQLRPALRLSRVAASISPRSVLASASSLELRLAQLLIDGAQLDVRRDAAGRLLIAGMDFGARAAGSRTGAADWFFRQREVAILGATLRWTDEQRSAPPLELTAVDLVVRNGLRRHDLRLDATPPPAWGDRFSVRGNFTQPLLARSGDWQRWSGEAFVDMPRGDAGRLRQYIDLPFALSRGVGAVRAWLQVHAGVADGVTLDLALRQVTLQLGTDLAPLAIEQLHGRLLGQRHPDGGSVSLRQFGFLTGDGVRWPSSDLDLTWVRGADGALGGKFSAGQLDLAAIAQTAARLPLGQAARRLLAEFNPRGAASGVSADWDGPLDALAHYRVAARLSGLSLDAGPPAQGSAPSRPGLRNAAIELVANEKGGDATLAMTDGAIELPGILAEAVVPLDTLAAKLHWRIEPHAGAEPTLQVQLSDARLANADAQAELHATWKTGTAQGARLPGLLELDGTLTRGVASRAARYLPLGLSEATRRYVTGAVRGGTVARASFKINGDLWAFPFFGAAPGQFRVALAVEDLTLAYLPSRPAQAGEAAYESPWPPMNHVSGELVIDRATLAFRDARAQIYGVELAALHGGIGNLLDKPVLTLETQGRGPVSDMLHFVDTTPVGDWIHGALRAGTASGNGELKLALALPLHDMGQSAVSGSLQLSGSDVRLRHEWPLLAAVRGRLDFSGKGFAIVDATARVLGGEVAVAGGTQPDGSLRFTAQGSASAEALRRMPELGPLARLAETLSGQSNYRLSWALVHGLPEIDLTSDLVGLGVDLPPPLRKAPEAALALRYQSALASAAGAPPIEATRLEIGNVVKAQYERDLAGDTPRVLRGGIGIFAPPPAPANGVAAAVEMDRLDVDAWGAVAERLFGPVTPGGAGGQPVARSGLAPTQVGLRVQELSVGGRTLTHVSAGLSQLDGLWRATVNADQLEGHAEYRPPGPGADGAQAGRVYARLSRLSLPKNDADEVTQLLDRQPANVPALDIVVDDLELRGKRLGRIEIQAVNRVAPTREWELTKLTLDVPEATLSATGRWATIAEAPLPRSAALVRRKADFNFQLDVSDSGALLHRLGTADAVRGAKGRLKGQIGWFGSPLTLDYPSLSGRFSIAIESGQFLQVQPGAARLLGVLSLQSLARRLTLDFRDVFQEGFVFDSVTGEVTIAHGVASTNRLLMRGVQAAVLMEGSADIASETQDLRVVVVPEINVGAVSLAYAVINPAIGLGTFLAQLFLRQPLIQANTREFHVTGPWADPQVEAVVRQPGQSVPDIEPPAAAAPGASSAPP